MKRCISKSWLPRIAATGLALCAMSGVYATDRSPSVPPAIAGDRSGIDPALGPPFTRRARPSMGDVDAPIIVIEIGSYTCSHCREFEERTFPKLKTIYIDTGMVRWTMLMTLQSGAPTPLKSTSNTYPFGIALDPADPGTRIMAIAHCALDQGRYWQNLEFLFEAGSLSPKDLDSALAKNRSLDRAKIDPCLVPGSPVFKEVLADVVESAEANIRHIPTFVIRKRRPDGKYIESRIEGYRPEADFGQAISQMLEAR